MKRYKMKKNNEPKVDVEILNDIIYTYLKWRRKRSSNLTSCLSDVSGWWKEMTMFYEWTFELYRNLALKELSA